MINPKILEDNEKCIHCGAAFNKHFNLCANCKSRDNSFKIDDSVLRNKAIEYRDGDMNNHHILLVTVENSIFGIMKLIVPYDSQIANRVKYYVDNGIREYLEEGLHQKYLIRIADFSEKSINRENYFVFSELL